MIGLNEQLQTERNQLDALLSAIWEGVCALTADGILTWANPAAKLLLQLSVDIPWEFNLLDRIQIENLSPTSSAISPSAVRRATLRTLKDETVPIAFNRTFLTSGVQVVGHLRRGHLRPDFHQHCRNLAALGSWRKTSHGVS